MGIVRPHLWFHDRAVEAAEFYVSVVPRSAVTRVVTAPPGVPDVPEGAPFLVELTLDGMPVTILAAGPARTLDEAFSMYLTCEDQAEVDHYWEALVADGGTHGPCGWLRDRFGLSWQVIPRRLEDLMTAPDPAGVARVTAAMLRMTRIRIGPLEDAYAGR